MCRRIGLPLAWLAGVLLLIGTPRGVAAHANYERSDPPANAILERAPGVVRVWFSEEPEPRFSELRVLDATGRRVDRGNMAPVPGEARALAIDLEPLAPGTYTVAWRVLSAVDGHITQGAFPFTVGLDQIPAPALIPTNLETAGAAPTPWEVLSRWLTLLTSVIVCGAFFFLPAVLGPALRTAARNGAESAAAAAWGAARQRGLALATIAAGLGLGAGLLALLVQAATATGLEPWQVFGPPLAALLGTRYSAVWAGRMLTLAALGGLALYLRRPGTPTCHRGWLLSGALGALLLLTTSLTSHAAAAQQGVLLATGADWLHLVATAIWLGGLVQLALALPAALSVLPPAQRGQLLALVIARFSGWAVLAVGGLVATGLYQTWLQVGDVEALITTPYGQALLLKLALLVPLLALGAFNLLLVSPRVASAVGRGARAALERLGVLERHFRLAVRAEVLLAALILAVVGVLTSLVPARDALRAQGIVRTLQADDVRAVLRIAPGEAGLNRFDVTLYESGRPLTSTERVVLRLTHQQHDMGTSELPLEPAEDGRYQAISGAISMAGTWEVQLLVRRAGRDDAQASVQLLAADPGAVRSQSGVAAGGGGPPSRLVSGISLLLAGVLLVLPAVQPARRRPRATAVLGGLLAGAGLTLGALGALSSEEALIPNPIPRTADSIARGQALYQQHCTVCHGVSGRGDGPLAASLNPRPADLRVHVSQHTEGQLWLWISDGVPGSAMPAFRDTLSDEDRWHLVNYLRAQFAPAQVADQR
jgi:copper transport protein